MGQNSSGPVSPRNQGEATQNQSPPPRPKAPPSQPLTPKTPNYVVAENRVLPSGVGDMGNARKLLRPVSQELSKFHPEFADIFKYDEGIPFEAGGDSSFDQNRNINKENTGLTNNLNLSSSHTDKELSHGSHPTSPVTEKRVNRISNGHIGQSQKLNGHISNGTIPNSSSGNTFLGQISKSQISNGQIPLESTDKSNISSSQGEPKLETNGHFATLEPPKRRQEMGLRRTHSLERERPQVSRMSRHRRQSSLTPLKDAVILEDPREHLYNVARHEPFSTVMPSTTSLPVKSTFELDYSLNVTYAQLAEYRRQKRQSELEEKTGLKLQALGAEISASSTVPKSPFDRANLGLTKSTPSVSTGSSDTGVSKSKKKKAPAPPPPTGQAPYNVSPSSEPPADYDMDDTSTYSPHRRYSAQVTKPKPSPNKMLTKSMSSEQLQSRRQMMDQVTPPPPVPSTPIPPPPPPPPPPPQFADPIDTTSKKSSTSVAKTSSVQNPALQRSLSDAKAQLEALKKLEDILRSPSAKSVANPESEKEKAEEAAAMETDSNEINISDREADKKLESFTITPVDTSISDSAPNEKPGTTEASSFSVINTPSGVRKMSSLLQHDIVLAAQARGAKVVKSKPPPTLEKPKDASEMFREELAKAANAREARRKEAESVQQEKNDNDEEQESGKKDKDTDDVVFQTSFLKVLKRSNSKTSGDVKIESSPGPSTEEVMASHGSEGVSKVEVKSSDLPEDSSRDQDRDADEVSSSSGSQRVFPSTWTPEHDLDPDDDILDDSREYTPRLSNEGFKSSVLPASMSELKADKKKKSKRQEKSKVETRQRAEPDGNDDKTKFGSIRKFRKSVHEGVRNAFGSISKASGKLLKRRKSQDFLDVTRVTKTDDDISEFERNPNWLLAGDGKGSLRRSTSDGSIGYSYQTDPETSDSAEDDDDDDNDFESVKDIDFGAGIDDLPSPRKTTPRGVPKVINDVKQMKRAGVAYVSQNGQIVVLPESQPVNVETDEQAGRAPKLFKKKGKKYTYESTVKQKEKKQREEAVSREIREKELQIEMERVKQIEMDEKFKRLRELETQERLQRIQTTSLQEQLTLLQQHQVQRAHVELTSGQVPYGSLGTGQSTSYLGNGQSTSYLGNGQSTSYLGNGQPTSYQDNGQSTSYLGSGQSPSYLGNGQSTSYLGNGVLLPSSHIIGQSSSSPYINGGQSRYQMSGLGQNVHSLTPMSMSHTNYAHHTGPIIGGGTSLTTPIMGTSSPRPLPSSTTLTSQELAYLSDCMRSMGVTPPVTQQQWAVLLSTISLNNPGIPGLEPSPLANSYSTSLGSGPDLSGIFGKSIDDVVSSKQPVLGMVNTPRQLPNDAILYKTILQGAVSNSNLYSQPTSLTQLHEIPSYQPQPRHLPTSMQQQHHHQQQYSTYNNQNDQPIFPPLSSSLSVSTTTTQSYPEHTQPSIIPPTSSPLQQQQPQQQQQQQQYHQEQQQQHYVSQVNVEHESTNVTPRDQQPFVSTEQTRVQSGTGTTSLPAKVYGPMGFRPVPFSISS